MPLCLQGRDSSMWVRAAPGATSPRGPLQDDHNSGPRAAAIAGIPTRNRDAFIQGTDTLAAARQSIHQSLEGSGICKRPQQARDRATGAKRARPPPPRPCESARRCRKRGPLNGATFSRPDKRRNPSENVKENHTFNQYALPLWHRYSLFSVRPLW